MSGTKKQINGSKMLVGGIGEALMAIDNRRTEFTIVNKAI